MLEGGGIEEELPPHHEALVIRWPVAAVGVGLPPAARDADTGRCPGSADPASTGTGSFNTAGAVARIMSARAILTASEAAHLKSKNMVPEKRHVWQWTTP